tara:strand:+ start:321 stop:515 length:195 start_codon:yes stop_codon:yes gene_type:complete
MIQAAVLKQFLKAFIASDVGKSLIKYKDEPNEADKKCQELELKIIELHLKLDALSEIVKNDEAK